MFATFGLIAIPSHVLPMPNEVPALVLLVGLAVGVDYSMFYLRREREERAKGRSERAALEAAAATSGRSVLISGLTVMVAMAGMFVTGDKTFAVVRRRDDDGRRGRDARARSPSCRRCSRGSATSVDRAAFRPAPPQHGGEGRIWGWIVDRVLRRPALAAAISGGLLLLLAAARDPDADGGGLARHVSRRTSRSSRRTSGCSRRSPGRRCPRT